MKNIYQRFQIVLFSVIALAVSACDDSDESGTVPPPSGPDATPVELTASSGYYYGQGDALSCDHYTLYLSNGEVFESDNTFTGAGTGVCLHIYAPIQDEIFISPGTYQVHQPIIQSWLYSFEQGSEQGGSYIYFGPDTAPVYIKEGSFVLEGSASGYSISGTVTGSDGNCYAISFSGNTAFENLAPEKPAELTKSGGVYFGTLMNDQFDNFSVYFMTQGVDDTNMSFSGEGTGIYFDMYVPVAGKTSIPAGTYRMSAEAGDHTFMPGEDMGGMTSGSFVYLLKPGGDADKRYIPVTDGTFTIEKQGYTYTMTAEVICSDRKTYKFSYTGTLFSILDPVGAIDYTELPVSGGYYFGTMMNDNYDNYTYFITSDEVIDMGGFFDGSGFAISFDMYGPLGTGVNPAVGTYSVFGDRENESLAFKYLPGADYGGGMLQGSYIWQRETAESDKVYVYIVDGTLNVAKSSEDNYTVKAHLFGDDGNEYNYMYSGALNMLDPFAGM